MKTSASPSSIPTWNWNVDDLLGSKLLERRIRHDSRHMHQLFHHLRLAQIIPQALRSHVQEDLRHFNILLGNHRQERGEKLEDIGQLFPHLRHWDHEILGDLVPDPGVPPVPFPAAAAPARPPAAPSLRACHHQRKVRSTRQDPRWLSSVPVGLRASRAPHPSCGEGLQPAPCERSDVRAVASNAAVAVFAAMRLREQPWASR